MINKKRTISFLLCILMLFTIASQVIASSSNNVLYKDKNLTIISIVESREYTKIKIEDKENNKTEFVESYLQ